MPLYEYECQACGRRTEALQRLDDPPLTECPHCGGSLKRLLSAPAFQFKGTGWYVTDYGRGGDGKKPEASGDGAKSAGSGDSGSAGDEAKPSKSETPAPSSS